MDDITIKPAAVSSGLATLEAWTGPRTASLAALFEKRDFPARSSSSSVGVYNAKAITATHYGELEAAMFGTPFYQAHFTPAEIAYCVRQERPRMHFAARWCAKEALAKCEPRFAGVDPTTVQVRSLPGGQPVLEVVEGGRARAIDFAVSLSHTPLMAIAVVAAAVRTGA